MIGAILISLASQVPSLADTTWPADSVAGVSDLTAWGRLFLAVPERQRVLAPFEVHERGVSPKPFLPLTGVPEVLDVESIAVLPNDEVALGTEPKIDSRTRDRILIASLGPAGAKVKAEIWFDYQPYGIHAETNRGIEGLCFADGRLLASAEQVVEQNGHRYAPIQSYDFATKRWAQYRARLTTDSGKISAITCRKTEKAREVVAVERHYSVSRLVRYTLPLLDGGGDLEPELLIDLAELYRETIPNFEGIARLDDGRFLLISDNDYGGKQGPTHIALVKPAPPQVRRIKPGAYVE